MPSLWSRAWCFHNRAYGTGRFRYQMCNAGQTRPRGAVDSAATVPVRRRPASTLPEVNHGPCATDIPLAARALRDPLAWLPAPAHGRLDVHAGASADPGAQRRGVAGAAAPPGIRARPGSSGSARRPVGLGSGIASAAPSASAAASASAATGGTVDKLTATGITFVETSIEAPADTAFTIEFDNQDAGVPHNVEIKDGRPAPRCSRARSPGPGRQDLRRRRRWPPGTYAFAAPSTRT